MARKITRAALEQAVTAERGSPAPPGYSDQEYAGRLWLRLGGIDPDAVQVPPEDAADARALEKAREVIARRSPVTGTGVMQQLAKWRDQLNSQ